MKKEGKTTGKPAPFARREKFCRCCGTCCRKGGPALHRQDLELIRDERLLPRHLFTIRQGEPAYSPLTGAIEPASVELVKTATMPGEWACCFYDELRSTCGVYAHRPLECRLLKCWAPGDLLDIIGQDTLTRRDIIEPGHPILQLLDRHDDECPSANITSWIPTDPARGNHPDQLNTLTKLIEKDLVIRRKALGEFGLGRAEELFFFGRPLFSILGAYGLEVRERESGLRACWRMEKVPLP